VTVSIFESASSKESPLNKKILDSIIITIFAPNLKILFVFNDMEDGLLSFFVYAGKTI